MLSLPRRVLQQRRLGSILPQLRLVKTPRSRSLATTVIPARDTSELDEITVLSNGVRVATEALPGHFSGIGVYVDAGSRYENERLRGVSHIVDRLAFKSTSTKTADEMMEAIETYGGNTQCASSRESLMYQSAIFNKDVPNMMGLMAETVLDPVVTEEEVAAQLETAAYEIGEIWSKPDLILPEILHSVAYKDNTLGNPLLCPEERLSQISRTNVLEYRDTFYRPERLVVAFAGVAHGEAVKMAEKYFGGLRPSVEDSASSSTSTSTDSSPALTPQSTPPSSPPPSPVGGILNKIPLFKNLSTSSSSPASVLETLPYKSSAINLSLPAHYTGGTYPLAVPPQPSHLPILSYLYIAFEALAISDPDVYALATLQTLLGGGGSFSAGGPGKGMYSRLYTNVLNQYGWIESCVAFNHSYTDSGMFGIAASCNPKASSAVAEVMLRELRNTFTSTGPAAITSAEVERAKNQLRSSLLMNLESRMVELEDLGRQVQVYGKKIGPREMGEKISALTVADIRRVAERVFTGQVRNVGNGTGKPTIVMMANEAEQAGLPTIERSVRKFGLGR